MFAREIFATVAGGPLGSLRGDGALGVANRIRMGLRKRTAAAAR
jgi:hypothetical protein